jgi:hypothetical protein
MLLRQHDDEYPDGYRGIGRIVTVTRQRGIVVDPMKRVAARRATL